MPRNLRPMLEPDVNSASMAERDTRVCLLQTLSTAAPSTVLTPAVTDFPSFLSAAKSKSLQLHVLQISCKCFRQFPVIYTGTMSTSRCLVHCKADVRPRAARKPQQPFHK